MISCVPQAGNCHGFANPQTAHGIPLANYVEGNWDTYLQSMVQQGTYGDHITLQRASELFSVQVQLWIQMQFPSYQTSMMRISGNIAEGHGEH